MPDDNDICKYKGNTYNLRYTLPTNDSVKGATFPCDLIAYLDDFGFLDSTTFLNLSIDKVPNVKVVTAITQDHFNEAGYLFKSFKQYFSNEEMIVYDLGLRRKAIDILNKISFIEYRKFNFSYYPPFVSTVKTYAFKWLVVAEVLKEYKSVIWADASLRFTRSNFMDDINELLNCYNGKDDGHKVSEQKQLMEDRTVDGSMDHRNVVCRRCFNYYKYVRTNNINPILYNFNVNHCYKSQVLMHIPMSHNILSTTHPIFSKFIPTDRNRHRHESQRQYGTGFVLFVRTKDTVENIMKWAVLCSLTEECIAPIPWFPCSGHFKKSNLFAKRHICYRFDQTLLTTLLHNNNNYDNRNYATEIYNYAEFNSKRFYKWESLIKDDEKLVKGDDLKFIYRYD
uniref:FCP1 homology domain-containing protein n=1 Tax=Parastrongyloides trichosuri TaxID=131310 RepID=A0A0N5A4M3_PARTI